MTKLLTATLIGSTLLLTGCFSDTAPLVGNDTVQPDYYFEIDGWGTNPDIYEFTPRSNPNYACVYLITGKDTAAGLQCFPKAGSADG